MKCMSQYLRIMSLKMRWPWIWATFGIQTTISPVVVACPSIVNLHWFLPSPDFVKVAQVDKVKDWYWQGLDTSWQ